MKSVTKAFDTFFEHRQFTVIYELNVNGTKQLTNIIYDGFPIDIAEIHGSDQHEEFYDHILGAMNNNAMSEMRRTPTDSLFDTMAQITRDHARSHYGITLQP